MPDSDYWSDIDCRETIAKDIIDSGFATGLSAAYLANQISEVTPESQTAGADILTLTMIDPDWIIQTSGLCTKDSDGLLPFVDINFPSGTDCWWRLNEVVNQGGDLTTPSLQLVFQHRLVSYLQWDWGDAIKVAPGTRTRAEFVKQLVDRIPAHLTPEVIGPGSAASHQIQFVCPELEVVQPVAASTSTETTAQLNKSRGIPRGAHLEVIGGSGTTLITNRQIDVANQALRQAVTYKAPEIVMVAMIYAALGESHLGALTGYQNVWQSTYSIPSISTQAEWWLTGGPSDSGFGGTAPYPAGHGALAVYQANPNYAAWQIAGDTERNAVWDGYTSLPAGSDSYGSHWPGGMAQGIAQAQAIVDAFGGSAVDGTSGDTKSVSDVSQLERGGPNNPNEDSWTCIQRLASEVNWMAFTSAHPAEGQWGNFIFWISAPRLDKQMPEGTFRRSDDNPGTWDLTHATKKQTQRVTNALNAQPSGSFDNSAFNYKVTRVKRGKVQRKVRIVQAQNPTQIQLQVIGIEPMTYNAGSVVMIENSGWANGRWIITDSTRNIIQDPFSTLTLGPPTTPTPEPAATSTSSTKAKWSTGDDNYQNYPKGTAARAIAAAQYLSNRGLPYIWGGDRDVTSTPTNGMDCSGSTSWVLYQAGFTLPGNATTAPVAADFMTWDDAGSGNEMTVWSSTGHVFIEFSLSGQDKMQMNTVNPGDLGPRLIPWAYSNADAGAGAAAAGFVPRHPKNV